MGFLRNIPYSNNSTAVNLMVINLMTVKLMTIKLTVKLHFLFETANTKKN